VKSKLKNFKPSTWKHVRQIKKLKPFGYALQFSLEKARKDDKEEIVYALWIEEDYYSPP
jgi:hypothetical protein